MRSAVSSAILAGLAFCAGASGQVVKRQSGNLPPVSISLRLILDEVLIVRRCQCRAMHSTPMESDSIFVVLLINQVDIVQVLDLRTLANNHRWSR